jgi:uncharacterized membrane-anchored protein
MATGLVLQVSALAVSSGCQPSSSQVALLASLLVVVLTLLLVLLVMWVTLVALPSDIDPVRDPLLLMV